MEQKICKNVIIPDPNKRPKNPFCSQSGLALKANGNGSFVCPPECEMLLEVQRTSGQFKVKDAKNPNLPR